MTTGRRAADRSARPASARPTEESGWSARLGSVIASLAAARTLDSLVEVVVAEAATAVGASVATLLAVDDRGANLLLIGIAGASPGAEQRWAVHPLTAHLPATDCLRAQAPLILSGRAAITERYPTLSVGDPEREASLLCLPMLAAGSPLGVIGLLFDSVWVPSASQWEFVQIFSATCAQALDRVRAAARADRDSTRLRFLVQASAELSRSLDFRATLTRVAELAVPTLADWCAVQIVEDGVLRSLAVTHKDPNMVAMARELETRYPADPDAATGAANVARTGVSELYAEITDEMLVAGTRDQEHLRLARALGLHSALVVPLTARGRVLGVLTLLSSESRVSYTSDDVSFAEQVAARAAIAIDNAQLYSETRDVALELQRAVLPAPWQPPDGWQVAPLYQPSGRTQVGGDFYDALPLPDGRLVAVIGDVMGRGVQAAAAMAQMRAAVRGYVAIEPDPATVMSRLDCMFALYGMSELVTIVMALISPDAGTVTFCNAGHLPPVVLEPDKAPRFAEGPRRLPPLGAGGADRKAVTCPFPAGSTLLLYTDGIVERRDEDIDAGLDRLLRAASPLPGDDLGSWLQDLVAAAGDERGDDDVTALAIRRT